MIPAFLPSGQLPPGRYLTDVGEVGVRLVDPFCLSLTRKRLYQAWRDRRGLIAGLLPLVMEWVGGSYSTAKRDPSDVDVVVFFRAVDFETLNPAQKEEIIDLVMGLPPKLRFGVDSYPVAVLEPAHPSYDRYLRTVGYWDRWWSADRTGGDRGYIEVRGAP